MRILKGHDPYASLTGTDIKGVDFLLTEYDDGVLELAVRPGCDLTHITWGPPTTLLPEPAEVWT